MDRTQRGLALDAHGYPPMPASASKVVPRGGFHCKVDKRLLAAVRQESLNQRVTLRQIVEWALLAYLHQANPSAADKFKEDADVWDAAAQTGAG